MKTEIDPYIEERLAIVRSSLEEDVRGLPIDTAIIELKKELHEGFTTKPTFGLSMYEVLMKGIQKLPEQEQLDKLLRATTYFLVFSAVQEAHPA